MKLVTISQPAANADDYNEDNSFMLWFTGLIDERPEQDQEPLPEPEIITSSEQYMGYPVGYTGPIFN